MIYIKEIKFDNPNLYYQGHLSVDDTILRGIRGMWKITHIDKNNILWCGGMKTEFKINQKNNFIFKPSFLRWLESLHSKFQKGDRIGGYNNEKKYFEGIIVDKFSSTNVQSHIWLKCDDGYTRSLNITTVKKLFL